MRILIPAWKTVTGVILRILLMALWITLWIILGVALSGLSFAQGLSKTTAKDPFADVLSHDIPHCSLKGGENSAKCSCLGMVGDVQAAEAKACYQGAILPFVLGPNQSVELGDPIMECLSKVPDHCEIVAYYADSARPEFLRWSSYHKFKNTCRTSCEPEKCGCADSACKSHSNTEVN